MQKKKNHLTTVGELTILFQVKQSSAELELTNKIMDLELKENKRSF